MAVGTRYVSTRAAGVRRDSRKNGHTVVAARQALHHLSRVAFALKRLSRSNALRQGVRAQRLPYWQVKPANAVAALASGHAAQHFLNLRPLPQGQGSLRPGLSAVTLGSPST